VIILVDGYNVLKQIKDGQEISEQQRSSFIKQLASYKKLRSHKKIIIVFDGGPDQWPSQEKIRGVIVVYAGALRTADDYIHSYIQENKAKAANMLLVSSDRQLCIWASDYDVASVDSWEFYRIVQQALKPLTVVKGQARVVKITENSSAELDKLMQESTKHLVFKQEDWSQKKLNMQKKLSKRERILLKKVKKL
jgi:predicted RNA-binding protein with PIN domain